MSCLLFVEPDMKTWKLGLRTKYFWKELKSAS